MSEVQSRFREGWSAFGGGNYELAELKLTEAIALDPTNLDFRIEKGLALESQERVDDALREFDRLLELFPDCVTAWTEKARILNNLGLYAEAEMCAENALRLNSKNSDAWDQKGRALENQHKLDEAMVCYEELIRLSPAEGWARKGSLLVFEYCDYENAVICFDKALLVDDQDWTAWNKKGAICFCMGEFEEAIKCCDNLLNIFPGDDAVWNNKGRVLIFQGKFQEAEECLQKACSLDPYNIDVVSLGYLCLHQGKFQEALKWFEKAFPLEREKDFVAQGKALCEYLMANQRPPTCPDPTAESLQNVHKLIHPELYLYRGKTLMTFGELEQAKKAFEKCLELNPNYKAAAIELDKIRQLRRRKESNSRSL